MMFGKISKSGGVAIAPETGPAVMEPTGLHVGAYHGIITCQV